MAEENKNYLFALIAMVAIVAIVAIILLFIQGKAETRTISLPISSSAGVTENTLSSQSSSSIDAATEAELSQLATTQANIAGQAIQTMKGINCWENSVVTGDHEKCSHYCLKYEGEPMSAWSHGYECCCLDSSKK